jgi:hypothetical protein
VDRGHVAGTDARQLVAGGHGLTHTDADRGDDAAHLSGDDVLHLHRLEDQQLLARMYGIAGSDADRDDGPLEGGSNRQDVHDG